MRRAVGRLGLGLALIWLATLLATVGAALWLWSLYGYIAASSGEGAAAALTGLVAVVVAGVLGWLVHRLLR